MRLARRSTFVILAMIAPFARSGAQTCLGTAEFREGKARVGLEYQHSTALDSYSESFAYGVQDAFFGGVSADQLQTAYGGAAMYGASASVGYQIHWTATPFQVCPLVTASYASGGGAHTTSLGFGGSLGYHAYIQPGFRIVPAFGIRAITSNTSGGGGSTTGTETFLNIGMVLDRAWSVVPGIVFPSSNNSPTRWTFLLAYNFGPNTLDSH